MNANNFNCPTFRVENQKHRLIATFNDEQDALKCATLGRKPRLLYRHNRPQNNCEGNYVFIGVYPAVAA